MIDCIRGGFGFGTIMKSLRNTRAAYMIEGILRTGISENRTRRRHYCRNTPVIPPVPTGRTAGPGNTSLPETSDFSTVLLSFLPGLPFPGADPVAPVTQITLHAIPRGLGTAGGVIAQQELVPCIDKQPVKGLVGAAIKSFMASKGVSALIIGSSLTVKP